MGSNENIETSYYTQKIKDIRFESELFTLGIGGAWHEATNTTVDVIKLTVGSDAEPISVDSFYLECNISRHKWQNYCN